MRETKCTTEKRGKKAKKEKGDGSLKPCSWMEWLWWLSDGTWQQEQLQWTVPPRRSTESKRKKVTIRTWTETQFNHQRMQNSSGFFFFFSHQNTYHVIPCMLSVEDDSSSKTPGWVNASSCDGDGGQVNQEHCKPNGEGGQNLHIFKNFG